MTSCFCCVIIALLTRNAFFLPTCSLDLYHDKLGLVGVVWKARKPRRTYHVTLLLCSVVASAVASAKHNNN